MKHRPAIHLLVAAFACCVLVTGTVAQGDDAAAWPREATSDFGDVVIYQPQLESYKNDRLESRAAVSVTPKGQTAPIFGAVWFSARMETDLEERLVSCVEVSVTAAKFPDASEEHLDRLTTFLEEEIPDWDITISLDLLLASFDTDHVENEEGFHDDPPEVVLVDHPAVLVVIDGDPKLADLQDTGLKYVVNSAYFIVQDPSSNTYYLKGGANWFTARDLLGEWKVAGDLPNSVAAVAKQIEEEEQKEREEAEKSGEEVPEASEADPVPEIIVRTGPAEIVETDGEPNLVPIEGTDLLYVKNTDNDIVLDIAGQQYYVLLAGRWYKSPSLTGTWAFVPFSEVPQGFAAIPDTSDMADVRPSVPGTIESKEAILESTIPQTAEVSRSEATVEVSYDGDPTFEKCADNGVAYAVNTDKAVLLINNRYYCCDQAVWFESDRATGPWTVSDEVPAEVQDIPPECPVYNVKYVYIYDSTPEVVYVGYTPAYTGVYVYGGCVVYGTGWWYQPWYQRYYYPRPVTWGFGVHYNPWTGWGFHFGVSYGWLHVGVGFRPYGGWWGPAGYRHGYRHGYHHGYRHGYRQGARRGYSAGYRAGKRQGSQNVYRNRSNGVKKTGNQRARTQTAKKSTAGKSQASKKNNNVYADKKGNTYRKQGNDWEKRDKDGWSSSKQPSGQSKQNLNKDNSSRQRSNNKSSQSRNRSGGGGRRR